MSNLVLTDSEAGSLIGMNCGNGSDYSEPLTMACNMLDAAADELDVLRHALYSDELDAEKFDLVLFRLRERMQAVSNIAWKKHRSATRKVRAVDETAEVTP